MSTKPEPPREALLIERKRKAFRPAFSVRKAAELADLSEGRWRQIALGYTAAAAGVKVPVRAPADTLARMALVVHATREELIEAGRPDAAEELEFLVGPRKTGVPPGGGGPIAETSREAGLNVVPDEDLIAELQRRLASRWRPETNREDVGNDADAARSSATNRRAPVSGAEETSDQTVTAAGDHSGDPDGGSEVGSMDSLKQRAQDLRRTRGAESKEQR